MQPATDGNAVAQHFAGGRVPMNSLLATYLLLTLLAMIVIAILENDDDHFA